VIKIYMKFACFDNCSGEVCEVRELQVLLSVLQYIHRPYSSFSRRSDKCNREKSPIMGRIPNMGRCIIYYQEVLHSVLKNINH
jgi:hypothetical protein